jgi:3-deoxy-D-arabino-heptulosonate 7-phosphate (DAHP) synthase
MYRTQDLHVKEIVRLLSPRELKAQTPSHDAINATVARSRERVIRILRQEDPRLLVVIGPCSIHDEKGALEYAEKLNALRKEFADRMEIVMRVYFEKPRTTIGWKGLINDPHLDGSQDIETGLKIARRLLAGNHRHGFAGGDGISRPDCAAIHRGFNHLGGHRRAHDGIADAPRNGERTFHARRLEKFHGRQFANRD